ncbi:Uncharacterized protein TCM_008797 [Theobroma cacao]|uniref:Uncharacterized protein n=1 Tax=Theobroma cacao TaxID=3641 RepID=A0A061E5C5_THECC|nr:Uncharacterized protein TCM_008797 [Theobroma cacao]
MARELYANAFEHYDGLAFVQGKQVPFHSQAINDFYKTLDIENNGQYLGNHQDLNKFILVLCVESAQWKLSKGKSIPFKASAMKEDIKDKSKKLLHLKPPISVGLIQRSYDPFTIGENVISSGLRSSNEVDVLSSANYMGMDMNNFPTLPDPPSIGVKLKRLESMNKSYGSLEEGENHVTSQSNAVGQHVARQNIGHCEHGSMAATTP